MAKKTEKAGEDPGNKLRFDKQQEGEIYDENDRPHKVTSLFYKGGSNFSIEAIIEGRKLTDFEIDEIGELTTYLLRNEEIDDSIIELVRLVTNLREKLEDLFAEDAEGQLNELGINEGRLQMTELNLAQKRSKALKKLDRLGVLQIKVESCFAPSIEIKEDIKIKEDIELFESELERLQNMKQSNN